MPADSCPRCCRAYSPKYVSFATSSPGAQTPKMPQASCGPFSPGSTSWVNRPSPRATGRVSHTPARLPAFDEDRDSRAEEPAEEQPDGADVAGQRGRREGVRAAAEHDRSHGAGEQPEDRAHQHERAVARGAPDPRRDGAG